MQRFYEYQVKEVLENMIKLEDYPNKVIKIFLVVIHNDGSVIF